MFKLSPTFPHEGQDTMNELAQPSMVLSPMEKNCENVDVLNPVHDYINPELVDLYVTETGGFQPSYIYRLLAEYYDPKDPKTFDA